MRFWKSLFGCGFVLFGLSSVIDSMTPAYAELGPSVSLGSNPIESFYQANCSSTLLFENTTQHTFIITDVYNNYSGWVQLKRGNNTIIQVQGYAEASFTSGIKVSPGDSIYCTHYSNRGVFISGYYAHN